MEAYFKRFWCDQRGSIAIPDMKPEIPEEFRHPTRISAPMRELMKKYETGAAPNGDLLVQGEPALQPYHAGSDDASVHTIGWGHAMWGSTQYTLRDGRTVDLYQWGTVITYEDASDIFDSDIAIRENQFNSFLDEYKVSMTQQQYDAFISLGYQNGMGFLTNTSKYSMARYIAYGDLNDYETIKIIFGDLNNHRQTGTMRRRLDELDVYIHGEYEYDGGETSRYGDIWGKNFTWNP